MNTLNNSGKRIFVMRQAISTLGHRLRKGLLLVVLVGLFSLPVWNIYVSPGYAVLDPDEALNEIKSDLQMQDRQKEYEHDREIVSDPKMGVEKEYDRNMQEYYKEHPDQAGVVGEVKELVNKVTGGDSSFKP